MADWGLHIRQWALLSVCVGAISTSASAQNAIQEAQALPVPQQNNDAGGVGEIFQSIQNDVMTATALVPEAPVASDPTISLGDFGVSMMYNEEDIDNVSRVLAAYEISVIPSINVAQGTDNGEQDILSELLRSMQGEEVITEEEQAMPFPNFYVGTIMYRRAGDWAVWVNGKRFDNKKPGDGVLQVKGIGRERVTLAWRPVNIARAHTIWKDRQNPNLGGRNHRHAHHSYVNFDEDSRSFTISLRSNQTFAGDQMDIIEGRIRGGLAAQQQALSGAGGANATNIPIMSQGSGSSTSLERQISDQLIGNMEQLQQFIPVTKSPAQ